MLINYETATDKELEQALSKLTITEENGEYKNLAHNGLWIGGDFPSYCTDWNATMPLAIEHGLDIELPIARLGGIGQITKYIAGNTDIMVDFVIGDNPLRAIVICLIKALEAKNDAGQKS
ncbi:hypothetical protein KW500_18515 [Vibrio fluvialis]|nr:hypothetical protein [Vibrio fluvialis]MBY8138809.1 hypothetical protein [Vibrio fluvialis]